MSFGGKKTRSSNLGRISGPFIKDSTVIIEKFIEAVKDLFTHVYTDKELYQDIHSLSDDQLFANLSEYLDDIKVSLFHTLSKNLDSISLKFLHMCDGKEGFEGYLKVLKEKWRNSSSATPLNRYETKSMRSAKDYVNKILQEDREKSQERSKSKSKSRVKPQLHESQYASVNLRGTSATKTLDSMYSSNYNMPLNQQLPEHLASASAKKGNLSARSIAKKVKKDEKLIKAVEEFTNFTREIVDPMTGRKLSFIS